ncbi:TonB C-terminal domain-containing protein [Sulfuricurvum sp.]|uniref:TonB C-terminal domain-containing protein n=1 Tax=Sulfuricurvum sp. TaxID=2025608 RepID=UPI00199C3167|nr:TonB C-terminal domain-containing protein [Sulfuricurvum sp.]MBD3798465.1 TonB C-terminal domain-containing protein [Campylobacterota bacterium]MBD3806267.1 TonB C-terminal domain-containing protein [Sulfuricurvum sp.]
MDTNHERYFLLSGFISIAFFALLLFLAGFSLFHSPKVEQSAMIQNDVIQVSISMEETQPQSISTPEPLVEEPVENSIEMPKLTPQKESVPEISDLFSHVKTEKIPKKSQEDAKHQDELNVLEKELSEQKDSPRISDRVSKIELAKPSIKMIVQGGSTGPVVNEYHAKIQGLVYTYFRPPNDSIGQSARIRMKISASGKLIAYSVLRQSSLNSFNHEVEWLKDRLSTIGFPEHPEGREAVLEFILTAKE